MPAELVSCPECRKKLRVPEDLIGQEVKCPTCGHTFTADLERVAPKPPAPDDVPARTSPVTRRGGDEDQPRRASRRSREDEDDRPRRRRPRYDDEEDDYDDRPRRSRRYAQAHRGPLILVLGILALVLGFSFVLPAVVMGPIAWIMGNGDMREMRAGRMDPEGLGMTNAGRICGMIATILFGAGIVLCCGFYGIMVMAAGAGGM
jgi:predicted Zn finger-like uncharacterized protein